MDNDIEVEKNLEEQEKAVVPNTESEVMLFLADELEPLRRTQTVDVYDLETEYAKTKKNKLWSVWIMLFLTFAVVVLVTVFTVGGLSASNKKIEVDFNSFKDLDLQNLFNQLQRTQENYDEASKRYAEIKGTRDSLLSQALRKRDNDLNLLNNSRLSRAAQKTRMDKITETYNAEISSIHSKYDADLATAETELKQYEEQLKSYDSETAARAQEWEQQMDSERQIYQLEKQRLIENYENQLETLRQNLESTRQKGLEDRLSATNEVTRRYENEIAAYDPVIKDSKTTGLINEFDGVGLQRFNAESIIGAEGNVSDSFAYVLREAQVDYDNLEYLYGHSSAIPQRNTMKSVVGAEQKLSANIVNKIARAAVSEINSKSASVAELSQQLQTAENQRDYAKSASQAYVNVLNKVPVDDKIAGFILDTNGSYGLSVFIRSNYSQNVRQDGGTRVEIYSGNNKVATGAILAVSGNYYISLDNDSDKPKVSAGDTFRISSKK